MADGVSIWTPILYLAVLVTALVVFSRVYRQRKLNDIARAELFYERNFAQEIYRSLREGSQVVPDNVLKMALLVWGATDFLRVMKIKECKPAVAQLAQNGMVGEVLEFRVGGTEKALDEEIKVIVGDALTLAPEWTSVVQTAGEVAQNDAVRRRLTFLSEFENDLKLMAGPDALERASKGETAWLVKKQKPAK
ncbi:Translocation protein SEC66 [Wickerhamiella sorbophila]|uniref:Translocation protein SEC66 n=1 Tax=Wickerhamiella sorbophila TaxID=45607 RepID=A0A2T0FMX4_9ASCO|nr:Translocation protein SEC66 [Wickerhamiella sorbophila]PRT56348.1 Translocation protein SEC66 [Wickerhamiella sorbophila]